MATNKNQAQQAPTSERTPDPNISTTPADPARGTPQQPSNGPVSPPPIKRTRVSGTFIAIAVAAVILIFLLIFILQNLASVTVYYLGAVGSLPLGVALLVAAVGGALLVTLVGTARIIQLRRVAKRRGTSPTKRS